LGCLTCNSYDNLNFTRKYSTYSTISGNLINSNDSNKLQTNKNLCVSSVVYNNAELEKQLILTDTKNKAGIYL